VTEGRKYLPQGTHVCHSSPRLYLYAKIQFYLTNSFYTDQAAVDI